MVAVVPLAVELRVVVLVAAAEAVAVGLVRVVAVSVVAVCCFVAESLSRAPLHLPPVSVVLDLTPPQRHCAAEALVPP